MHPRFRQLFQLCRRVSQVEQEIGFNAAGIIDLTKRAEVFFRGLEIFVVIIFNSEPVQDLWWHVHIRASGHELFTSLVTADRFFK